MADGMDEEILHDGADPRLLLLLASIFRTGPDATVEITVGVEGAVISGSVVSEHAWIRRQNDQVRIGSPAIAAALDAWEPAAEWHQPYLHFLGPELVSAGGRVPLQATRVDVRKVAAWSIGRVPGD